MMTNSQPNDQMFDERARPTGELRRPAYAAWYLGKSTKTLAAYRCRGVGPKHLKIGHEIFYLEAELQRYRASCERQSTRDSLPYQGRDTAEHSRVREAR